MPPAASWMYGAQVRGLLLVVFAVIAWLGSRDASAVGVGCGAGPHRLVRAATEQQKGLTDSGATATGVPRPYSAVTR